MIAVGALSPGPGSIREKTTLVIKFIKYHNQACLRHCHHAQRFCKVSVRTLHEPLGFRLRPSPNRVIMTHFVVCHAFDSPSPMRIGNRDTAAIRTPPSSVPAQLQMIVYLPVHHIHHTSCIHPLMAHWMTSEAPNHLQTLYFCLVDLPL